jgi:hypothetical protein
MKKEYDCRSTFAISTRRKTLHPIWSGLSCLNEGVMLNAITPNWHFRRNTKRPSDETAKRDCNWGGIQCCGAVGDRWTLWFCVWGRITRWTIHVQHVRVRDRWCECTIKTWLSTSGPLRGEDAWSLAGEQMTVSQGEEEVGDKLRFCANCITLEPSLYPSHLFSSFAGSQRGGWWFDVSRPNWFVTR